jgi:hypothetical protein
MKRYCAGEEKWYPEDQFQPYPNSQGRLAHMVAVVKYRHYADNGDLLVPLEIPSGATLLSSSYEYRLFLEQTSREGSETNE